jgi:hypothetical protein
MIDHDDDQPLWGAAAIGKPLGLDERQARHLLEKGVLPAQKIGGKWVSTRRRLRERVVGQPDAA